MPQRLLTGKWTMTRGELGMSGVQAVSAIQLRWILLSKLGGRGVNKNIHANQWRQ